MAGISETYCLNHPDTPAVARCATCGKHICAQCVVSRNGSQYCSEACAEAAVNSAGRVNTAMEAERRTAAKARVRNIILLIIIIAIAAAAYCFYRGNRDEVNSSIQKIGKNVQKNLDSTKKSIQKSVPAESKYKRDREGAVGK